MAYNGDIKFKNISSKTYPLTITTPPQITHPEKITDTYNIPGRVGELYGDIVTRGNAQIAINMALVAADDWTNEVSAYAIEYRQVRQWLTGRGRLVISDAPDAYYEVLQVDIATDDRTILRLGQLQVIFTVYPVEFLNSGETALEGGTINNPGSQSMPIYKIIGNGTGVLTVNGKTMSYTVAGTLYIDTRRWIAYDANKNDKNNQLAGDYKDLWLEPGENTVAATAGTLAIYPYWGVEL